MIVINPHSNRHMAEAHSAVAFSFSVTPEGVDVNVNHEALRAVWVSGVRSWKKKIALFMNHVHNGVYPASPASWLVTSGAFVGLHYAGLKQICKVVDFVSQLPGFNLIKTHETNRKIVACIAFSTGVWFVGIATLRYTLKLMFCYKGWMYEPHGKMSIGTKIWLMGVKVLVSRRPLLYSYQGSLPSLPIPSINDTMKRYLRSVRPLLNDTQYARMERLVEEFRKGDGPRFQRYLILKSWWASNYVSDWWEEYVYLRGRSPIMVNSNFYGLDAIMIHPTSIQVARAANAIYAMLMFRRQMDKELIEPIMLNGTIPLCSAQYERQFNTTRIPGEESDKLVHYKSSKHIVVYHKGRYFKVYVHYKGVLLMPRQIEQMLEKIVLDESEPVKGEKTLAAMTAGDRIPWAKARVEYFSKGVNKTSLEAIEKAAFVVVLDDEEHDYDEEDPSRLNNFGKSMLHGKGFDRWFDKSFTLVICRNGRMGFNAEHSWADAPIMAHLWEHTLMEDTVKIGYTADGHTRGDIPFNAPNPIRLQWDIEDECCKIIDQQLSIAKALIDDVDLNLLKHNAFGKGFIKTCKMSPDAFIQMALQLAYFRDAGKFCLTYEASMTRLFREGRTETVRSCTIESAAFVKAMMDANATKEEKVKLFRKATDRHQLGYKDAMSGKGIDRHLFCLYVVSKYLGVESAFLKEVLSEPWRLSTSQTPHQQTDKLDLVRNPEFISAGGGFGPVADDGYGVSYIIAGEDVIFFHISCKKSCNETDSERFARNIKKAMSDMKNLFV